MPIKKAAKKFQKSSFRKRLDNTRVKKRMRELTKKTRALIEDKKLKKANAFFKMAQKAIDKASQKKVIKKNNAARKKSALASLLRKSQKK